MKNSKKISVLISLVLILLLAIGAASAADDAGITDDADLASVDEVQTVDNTQTTDEIYTEPTDIVADTGDSGDLDDADSDVISDTGQKDDSDDGDEAVVSDASSPKNALKAEPLRAEGDGTFTELYNLIRNGGTVTLNKNYAYNPSTDSSLRDGMTIAADLTINGNGHTIDGAGVAKIFILNGYTSSFIRTTYHGHTYTFKDLNFINAYSTTLGGVITSQDYPNTITISNCNFTNNQGYRGAAIYASVLEDTFARPVDTGSITITGCIFKENYASNNGGAIYSGINYDTSSFRISNNVFVNNTSPGAAKAIFYANANYINVNYNWWGQNGWNNGFVAQSSANYIIPQYSYQAAISQTGSNSVKVEMVLNGSTAPSGSTLPARNATFSIGSGAIESTGPLTADFVASTDTTITAKVDNGNVTLNVYKSPKWDINELEVIGTSADLPNQPTIIVNSDVDGIYNITIGSYTNTVNVQNGQGTLTLEGFGEGDYVVIASRTNDPIYNDKFASGTFSIGKQTVIIEIEASDDDITYGEEVTITPHVISHDFDESAIQYYVDGHIVASSTLSGLSVGTHNVIAKFDGNATHKAAESNKIEINVDKAQVSLSVDDVTVPYGQPGTVTIHTNVPGYYTVTVGDLDPIVVKVTGETKDVTISDLLPTGTYDLTVSFDGDENHYARTYPASYVVGRDSIHASVTPQNPTYPDAGQVVVSSNVDGTYIVTIDEKDYEVLVENGQGTVDIDKLDAGDYVISLSAEIEEYDPIEIENAGTYTVNQGEVEFSISPKDAEVIYGDLANVTALITEGATGTITYYVDGVAQAPVEVSGEYGVRDLSAGTHTIFAKYSGDDNYKDAESNTIEITVAQATPILYVVPYNVTYPNNANVVIVAYSRNMVGLNLTVRVTINGVTYALDTVDGGNYLTIEGLDVGKYPITAVTVANENYASATNNTQKLEIYKANLTITAVPSATSVVMGDEISFTNTITAPEGAVTSGTVTYYVDGEAISGDSISDLSVGTHSVVAKYTGDLNFNDAESTAVPFTVTEAAIVVTGQSTSVVYPNKGNIVITTNVAGTYTIKVGDVTYEDVTLAAGENIFPVTDVLPVGDHAVKVSANIEDYQEITDVSIATYTVTKGDLTIAVNPNATNIKYGESVTLESTISAPEGAQTAGTVTYYVDGVAISGNTLPKLSVGTHTVVAKYTGDSNFNDAESASKTITVGKKTPIVDVFANPSYTYPNDVRFIVEVYDEGPSQSLEGVTVEVTVNEVTYVGVTGVDGTVEFTIKGLNVGEYTIYATSLENENYTSAQYNEEEFAVVKATATVTSGDVTVYYPANGKVNITASVPGTYTVKVGNDEYTATVTTAGGTATVDIPTLDVGEYGISVTADLGNNYNPVDTGVINTYTVSPGTLIVTVENVTVSYPNTGVVTVKSNVDGDYEVIVNSRVYWAHVVDGEGSVTVQKLNYGIYNIRVQGIIDNYETFNELVAKYTVTKGTIEVTAQDASVTYPQTSPIVITTDVAGTYTLKIGETFSKEVELEAGENTVVIDSILDAGTYEVSVSATIDNYKPVEDKVVATYTVNKAQSTIDVTYEDGEFTITLDGVDGEKLNETVKVAIDGTAIDPIETDDGVYTFSYAGLAPGRHSILVTFEGNTNYLGDSKNYGFDVDKHTPTLEVFIENLVYGQDAYIVAELKEGDTGLTGVVEVTISGYEDPFIVAVAEGTGILPIAGLNAGTYTYTAKSVADSTYASATQDERTFVVAPRTVTIEVDTFGGVDFGDEGEIEVRLHDAETDERIKDEVTLIFTDENGNVLETITVETAVGPWDRGERLDFTAEWLMGDYYVTVENPNYIFVKYDDSKYKFTSFGDEAGEIEYSTGTVEEIESDDDRWTKVRVLTNDADESYVGNEYYIDPDVNYDTEQTYQLYVFDEDIDDYVGTGIWVLVHKDLIPDPAKYDYPVHKVGIGVNLVSGDGGYVYGYDHEVVLQLLKYDGDDYEDGEPVEIDCPALVVVFKFNGETEEWEEIDTITDAFEAGRISIDCSAFKPGEFKLKVSISDDTYELRYWNDEEDRDVDYRLFWEEGSLFQVDKDHVYIEKVIGEESTRFGYEHDFSFEVWHSPYDDVRELFEHDFDATVKVYKWNDETEKYDLVDTIPVEISGGKSETIDFSELKVGHYKVTVTLDDSDYAFEEWDDDISEDVNYARIYFEIYQDNIHANVEGRDWTEYGQERIFKFDLTHWDDDAEEDVLFEYNTNAIVKVYKLTWDDEGVESAELIDTYSVAINDGHSEAIDLSDLNAGSYRVTIQLDDEDYALDYWFNGEYGIQEERFDVGRANVDITVEFDKDGYIYGDDVIVTVTITPQTTDEKLTEEIELNIMGKESIKKHLVDGVATFTLEDYEAALYTIWVNFKGTDNYNDIYNYIDSFIIDKASPVINVAGSEKTYPENGTVLLNVADENGNPLSGITVYVTVNDVDYVVVANNGGVASLSISGLDAGEYPISAVTVATDDYASASYIGNAKVVINKITPIVNIPNSYIVNYPDTGYMGIISSVPGTYTVKVGTEEIPVVITEANKIVIFNITKVFDVGRYNVSVTADLGKNYEPVDTGAIATYTVNNGTIIISAEDTAVEYPGKGDIYITTNAAGEYTIVIGDKTYTKTLDSGENKLSVSDEFAPGTYDVFVSATIPNYNAVVNQKIATYTVGLIEIEVSCENVTAYYPERELFYFFASKDGVYVITLAGTDHYVNVENGRAVVYPPLMINAGVYDVTVSVDFGEDYKPLENVKIGTYTVLKGDITLTVIPNVTEIKYGDTIRLANRNNHDIQLDSQYLTYLVDGQAIEGNIVRGLSVGTHNVAVRYAGDPNIEDVESAPKTITVSKITPIVEVNDTNAEWGTPVSIPVKVTDENGNPIAGSVIVTVDWDVDGKTQVVELDENGWGEATFTITEALGRLRITANYTGSDNIESVEDIATLFIGESTQLTLEVTANEVTFGEDTILTLTATNARGIEIPLVNANVTIDGATERYPVVNGKINLGKLPVGENDITVKAGGGIYNWDEDTVTAIVNPAVPVLVVTPGTGQVTVETYGIDGPIGGTAKIIVDGDAEHPITVTIDETGHIVVPIDAAPGGHAVEVIFNNDNYVEARQTVAVNVPKLTPIVSVTGATVEYGNPATVKVKVTDVEGNPIEGTVIVVASWLVDGETQVVELDTDGTGEATFVLAGLGQGNSADINATFVENDNYASAYNDTEKIHVTDSSELTLEVTANEVTVGENTILTITATDGSGAAVDLDKVNVTIGDVSRELDVVNGQVNIGPLPVGTTEILVSVDDEFYGHAQDSTEAKVNKAIADVTVTPGNGTVTVVAKDKETGEPISGTATVVIDGGEPVEVPIGENGTIEYPIDAAPGPHTVEVRFNNDNYEPVTKTVTVIVPKAIPIVEVNNTNGEWGVPVSIPVKVTDAEGNPLTGSVIITVDWDVDGKTQVVELDENGWGEATFTITEALDELRITANYTGNDNYESVKETATLFIGESTKLTLEVTANEVTFGEDTILTVTAKDGRGVEVLLVNANVTIGDVTERYPVVNGKINVGKLPVGETEITVKAGGGIYNWDEDTTTAVVKPAVPVLIVTPGTGQVTVETYGIDGPIGGTAKIIVDGDAEHPITVTIDETGEIVVPINAAPGGHAVEVIFNNDNYVEARQTVAVNVPKLTPIVSVTGATVEYGNPATVKVKVTDEEGNPIEGTVIVVASWLVDGETQVVELDTDGTGEATFVLAGLDQGNSANINATYVETDNYASAYNDTEKIYVTDSSELTLEVTANEVTVGENTIITVTAKDGSGADVDLAKVNVTIDGTTKEYAVENGQVNIGKLPVGTTEILVSVDDEFYGHAQDTTEAKVNKAAADVTVTPGNGTVTVVAKDNETGQPISGTATVVIDGGEPKEVPIGEDGTIEYPIDAAPGPHTVEVTFNNDDYEPVTKTVTVIVPKLTPIVEVNDTNTEWGTPVTIPVKVTDADGNPLTGSVIVTVDWDVDGKTQVVELDENGWGEATFTITEALGDLTITANYTGNDNYESVKGTATLTITDSTELLITVTANEVDYGEDTIITIEAENGRGGTVTLTQVNVTIDDGEAQLLAVGEDGKINLGKLNAGEHKIAVSYVDETYEEASAETVAVVSPIAALIEATIDNYPFDQTGQLIITVTDLDGNKLDGTVGVEVDGEMVDPSVTVTAGEAIVDLTGYAVGEHSAFVVFNSTNYRPVEATAHFTVTKKTPTIDVEADDDLMPGDSAVVTVTVKDGEKGINGTAVVTVGGTDYAVEIIDGTGKVTITDLVPNEYDIAAKFLETENYTEAVYSGDAAIDFLFHYASYDLIVENITYGEGFVVTIKNVKDSEGNLLDGTVSGQIVDANGQGAGLGIITITNGEGSRTYTGLNAGNYTVTTYFDGMDDDYVMYYADKNASASVAKAQSDIAVTYENGKFTITLDGVNGEKLNETVTVAIDGTPIDIAAKTDNGTFSFTDNSIAPGDHTVLVSFAGNNNYLGDFDNLGFKVPKATPIVLVTGDTVEYGDPATVKVKVTDEDGNPITGTVIVVASWLVDGETQVVELDENGEGQATFVLAGLGQGNYADINATFVENDNYASAYNDTEKIRVTDSSELTLEVTANEVTLGEDTILTITAKDGSGAAVDLAKVNVTIDGTTKEYAVENGQVNIGKLPVGTTEILVSVDDEFYGHAQDSTEAKVNKAAADVTVTPGEGTVTVVAKDKETGEPISGTATVVIDGGEPIEVPIGEDGTIVYPIDAAPGPHTVEVTFNNDDYEPVTKTVTVVVPKAETTLTIATEDVPSYGDDVTVTATITEGATGTITYYVDGSAIGTELAIGKDFVVSGLSAGEHNVTAKYAGDDLYGPAESNVLKFTVAKAELKITIDSAQTYYPNTGTVEVSANNDGVYTINVNDKAYTVSIVNGKGTFEVTEVLPVAEYPITWDIAESENYTGATGSAVYKVLNTAPDFSITGSSEIDYGNTNTIVPTINEDATGTITYTVNGVEKGTLGLKENLVLEGLDADHYIVVAEYSGDVNYGSMSKTFEFDVLPIDVLVSVSSDEVYYPNTGSVNLNVSAPGTYIVYVGNKSYEVEVTAPGVVNIPVELLEVGKYDINVTAPATTNYNAVDTGAIGTYVVSKAKSIIKVEYDPATGKATVTLEGAEGHIPLNESISFEIDGTAIPGVETTAGEYVSEDLALSPGKHSIFVVFVGNDNYLGSYDQTAFEVDKFATAEVSVSADPIKEGEEAVILITVKDGDKGLTGVVTVTLDGTDYAVDVTDGEGTLTVKNLVATTSPVTTYDITAKFNGNDEYAEATGTGTIDVTDYNDVIIVISGGQDSAVATLVDTDGNNINGKVNVTVDDEEPQEFDVVDGKVIIPIDEKGDHEISVDYLGDETHPSASKTDTVFVGKTLISTTLTLTVSDITYTEDEEAVVVLSAEDGSRISGTVTLTIGDKVQEVTITDGIGVTTVTGLSAGKKTAIAEFAESGKYAYSIATAPFEVRQMNTRIVARNMTTTAINVTEDGRIGEYLVWTLVDEKGRPLAGKQMSIGFNAKVYNRTTDENGQARLQINLQNSGPYTFAISFLGDDNYNGSFEVVVINVNKQKATLTASGATYKASAATKTLSATFKTKAGNPIVGKTIKFTVNGKTYSAKTDSKGVAKVNVSLTKAGSYTVEVKAPATNTYAETIKKVTLKLT